MVDVAELDDVSGVLLMGVLFAVLFESLSTCILSPVIVTVLLRRWPQRESP